MKIADVVYDTLWYCRTSDSAMFYKLTMMKAQKSRFLRGFGYLECSLLNFAVVSYFRFRYFCNKICRISYILGLFFFKYFSGDKILGYSIRIASHYQRKTVNFSGDLKWDQ